MSLTGHWVDDDWNLQKRVLNFCLVPDHKGETLGEKIEECLLEWDIGNIFTITVDNASSNNSAITYLKTVSKDWQGVILDNEFIHIRCCTHIVNLIVKSALEYIDNSVKKIRNAILYVRSSPGRLEQFKKCVEKEKIPDRSLLSLDVETRWNATYLMLLSAVKFEKAFFRLAKENKTFRDHFGANGPPNVQDWEYAKDFIVLMKPFCDVTVRLSGSQYVTSTLFFHDFITIHDKLVKLSRRTDRNWSLMAVEMKNKFEKYWGNVTDMNPLLFMAVALDPRFKLKFIDFSCKLLYDRVKAKEFTSTIESGLTRLYEFYVEADAGTSSDSRNSNQQPPFNIDEGVDDISSILASQFALHLKEIENREMNSELTRFLKENCEENNEKFDILNWWKVNSRKYPVLSKLAKDILAVPVSTVASESAFSTSGRIISSFRTSLSPKMVEALICGQSWIRQSHRNVDLEEIIRDLKNCEALEEELADLNCGD
ncbi:unnamed protein product [Urochloa humidicola]